MKKYTSIFPALLLTATSIGCTNAEESAPAADPQTKQETAVTETAAPELSFGETLTLNFTDYCEV